MQSLVPVIHSLNLLLILILCWLLYRLIRLWWRQRGHQERDPKPKGDLLVDALREQAESRRLAERFKQASDQALADFSRLHHQILDHLPVGAMVLNEEGYCSYANPAAESLYPNRVLQEEPLADIAPELWAALPLLSAEPEGGRVEVEIEEVQSSGNRQIVCTWTSLPDTRLLITLRDTTALHLLEEKLQMKRDLALMGEMASGVTHEVKNALAIIRGHTQLLTVDSLRDHRGKILAECDRLRHCVQAFMRSSREESSSLESLRLEYWLQEQADVWQGRPEGDRVRFDIESETASWVLADPAKVEIALNNLIRNGLEATEGMNDRPQVNVRLELAPRRVTMVVEDCGPGFPTQVRHKLFVPFVSSKEQGSGLGLFHARKVVMEHGGHIEVPEGQPTRVLCHLPLAEPQPTTPITE